MKTWIVKPAHAQTMAMALIAVGTGVAFWVGQGIQAALPPFLLLSAFALVVELGRRRSDAVAGAQASDEAIKLAAEVDVVLPEGFTWRKGHWRGRNQAIEIDGALRYTWRPPRRTGPAASTTS